MHLLLVLILALSYYEGVPPLSITHFIKYSRHFLFVEHIITINRYSPSFDNFVGKLDVTLHLVTG